MCASACRSTHTLRGDGFACASSPVGCGAHSADRVKSCPRARKKGRATPCLGRTESAIWVVVVLRGSSMVDIPASREDMRDGPLVSGHGMDAWAGLRGSVDDGASLVWRLGSSLPCGGRSGAMWRRLRRGSAPPHGCDSLGSNCLESARLARWPVDHIWRGHRQGHCRDIDLAGLCFLCFAKRREAPRPLVAHRVPEGSLEGDGNRDC